MASHGRFCGGSEVTQLRYSGTFDVPRDIGSILPFLEDPDRLFSSVPGVEKIDAVDGKVRVKFRLDLRSLGVADAGGYMSTITSVMFFEHRFDGRTFSMTGKGRSAGSSISTEITVLLYPENDGTTRLDWSATVDPGLIMSVLGKTKVSAASDVLIKLIIDGFRLAVSAT